MATALGIGAAFTTDVSADTTAHDSAGTQAATGPGDYHYASVDRMSANIAPVAVGETFSGGVMDTAVVIPFSAILKNDYDVDGDTLRLADITSTSHGSVDVDWERGLVTFTPDEGFTGTANFHYRIADDHGGFAEAAMKVAVHDNTTPPPDDPTPTPIDPDPTPPPDVPNAPPIAAADGITVLEDGGATDYTQSFATIIQAEALLANDIDPNGDPLHISWVGNGTHCSVTLQDDGTVRLATDQNYHGQAVFQYEVSDNNGGSATQSVFVDVLSVNDKPVVEVVEFGTPVYCYQHVIQEHSYFDEGHNEYRTYMTDDVTRIYDPAEALQVYEIGQTGGPPVHDPHDPYYNITENGQSYTSPAWYQDGSLIPVAFDHSDAWEQISWIIDEAPVYQRVDDPRIDAGRIVAWDPDDPSSQLSYEIVSNPLHGSASEDGSHWSYASTPGDQYKGLAPFTVRVTDSEGAYTDAQVDVRHCGTGGGGKKPVVMDLDNDGLEFAGLDDSNVFFDVNGDGWREHIAWSGSDDGLLAFDRDNDNIINHFNEISFVGYKKGAHTDLEGLQAFDSDGDGKLTSHDAQWAKFGVWQDKNQDGVADPGEFKHLDDMGITAVNLTSDGKEQVIGDVTLHGTTVYEKADGTTGIVGDVEFRYTNEVAPGQQLAAEGTTTGNQSAVQAGHEIDHRGDQGDGSLSHAGHPCDTSVTSLSGVEHPPADTSVTSLSGEEHPPSDLLQKEVEPVGGSSQVTAEVLPSPHIEPSSNSELTTHGSVTMGDKTSHPTDEAVAGDPFTAASTVQGDVNTDHPQLNVEATTGVTDLHAAVSQGLTAEPVPVASGDIPSALPESGAPTFTFISDGEIAREMNQFMDICASTILDSPSDLYISPAVPPVDTILVGDVLNDIIDKNDPIV